MLVQINVSKISKENLLYIFFERLGYCIQIFLFYYYELFKARYCAQKLRVWACISDVCMINITYNLVDDYVTPPAVVLELHWALKG